MSVITAGSLGIQENNQVSHLVQEKNQASLLLGSIIRFYFINCHCYDFPEYFPDNIGLTNI